MLLSGVPGSLNDVNVQQRSNLLDAIVDGTMPQIDYMINNNQYSLPYWLVDGIYPKWAVFVKSVQCPIEESERYFAEQQEATRKDVERGFGVLQSRFAIIKNPARQWSEARMASIMKTCIILHNMIVEDERENYPSMRKAVYRKQKGTDSELEIVHERTTILDCPERMEASLAGRIAKIEETRDQQTHFNRMRDLRIHHWMQKGTSSRC
jgi:hypothetical protein